jgi:hypothetical protein
MEAKQRQNCAALQDEVARLERELSGGAATAPASEPAPMPAPAPARARRARQGPRSPTT